MIDQTKITELLGRLDESGTEEEKDEAVRYIFGSLREHPLIAIAMAKDTADRLRLLMAIPSEVINVLADSLEKMPLPREAEAEYPHLRAKVKLSVGILKAWGESRGHWLDSLEEYGVEQKYFER